jgi:predicted nuclease of predicted toxin-antitoxin system
MKFIVDEQLPQRLAAWLREKGYDAIHADDIPHTAGRLTDVAICKFADKHDRVVITKDEDFWQRYLMIREPKKLIYVTTGNIKNGNLIQLFDNNIHLLVLHITSHSVIEINQRGMVIRF